MMNAAKRKAIEAAGWKIGDAADFLGMSDEERQLLDLRGSIARAVRQQREALNLSQKQLSVRLKTSQPRVAKIEQAAPDVSTDQLVRALTAAGGRIVVKSPRARSDKGQATRDIVVEVTTTRST